jgi:hypothetical protein
MSVINDIGNFIGSGKADTVFNDAKNIASTIGVYKPPPDATAQQPTATNKLLNNISDALKSFEDGYIKGKTKQYLPYMVIGGIVVIFVIGLVVKGK